jgi:hypothetical protein
LVAGINKFLRVYYGKVTELYRELDLWLHKTEHLSGEKTHPFSPFWRFSFYLKIFLNYFQKTYWLFLAGFLYPISAVL